MIDMRARGVVVALVLAVGASPLTAQAPQAAHLTIGVGRSTAERADTTVMVPPTAYGAFGPRLFLGVVGASVGIVGGALIGTHALPRSQCGDDPGLCEAVMGATIGTIVGAALGAALPGQGTRCTFGTLAGFGFAGALGGALLGTIGRGGGRLYVIYLGSSVGAAVGAAMGSTRC